MLVIYSRSTGNLKLISLIKERALKEAVLLGANDLDFLILPNNTDISLNSHKVVLDSEGKFIELQYLKKTTLSKKEPSKTIDNESVPETELVKGNEINVGLLDRPIPIIKKVLNKIKDTDRLILYQIAEVDGRNREEVLEYFKKRGL